MSKLGRRQIVADVPSPTRAWHRLPAYGLVAVLAVLFLWINLKTVASSPPWVDEVMQVDAGVNLHLGKGWISTAWQSQSMQEFWAANNPLYTLLVYCWISIFGFSLAAVRSLNYILALATAALIVDTCKCSGIIRSAWGPWVLAALLVSNTAVAFVYRSGRADLATMLVLAILFRAYALARHGRERSLFVCALPLLASGLQAIPCVAALLCLQFAIGNKPRFREVAAIVSGSAAGGAVMAVFFLWKHALYAYTAQTFASNYNILGSALQVVVLRDSLAIERFLEKVYALSPASVLRDIASDGSLLPLVIYLLCVAVAVGIWAKSSKLRLSVSAGLIAAILIPYTMLAAGRYPLYYTWMGATPVVIAFVATLERCWEEKRRLLSGLGVVAAVIAVTLGAPQQIWFDIHGADPSTAYGVVEQQLRHEVHAGEGVYGDPVFYYAAKAQGILFMSTSYAGGRGYPRIRDDESAKVSVMIVQPGDVPDALGKFGGTWTQVGTLQSPYGFPLVVLRHAAQ